MYTSDIRYADLKSTNTVPIKGTRRHVLYSDHKYGIEVGDFNSKVRFGFVVYKPSQYAVSKFGWSSRFSSQCARTMARGVWET